MLMLNKKYRSNFTFESLIGDCLSLFHYFFHCFTTKLGCFIIPTCRSLVFTREKPSKFNQNLLNLQNSPEWINFLTNENLNCRINKSVANPSPMCVTDFPKAKMVAKWRYEWRNWLFLKNNFPQSCAYPRKFHMHNVVFRDQTLSTT